MSDQGACHVEPIIKTLTTAEQSCIEVVSLAVWGMGCANCAARVRNSLLAVQGVLETEVLPALGMAQVLYNPTLVAIDQILTAVASAGGDGRHEYHARLLETSQP